MDCLLSALSLLVRSPALQLSVRVLVGGPSCMPSGCIQALDWKSVAHVHLYCVKDCPATLPSSERIGIAQFQEMSIRHW